jgi:hypothetical protein|tara:strand:- start:680 stop:1537 length:858 start_codon:yes stop_codon:yes gene_type:complete
MAIVRKVLIDDFDETYPLLRNFNNTSLAMADWKRLFASHWESDAGHCGYVLVDGKKIVGYLGMLFSVRAVREQHHNKFCNISSWIVEKEYRNESFSLLLQLLKLKEYTVTNFTPDETTYVASKKLGFKEFETHSRILVPFPSLKALCGDCSIVDNKGAIKQFLKDDCRQIYNDHLFFDCIHLWIKTRTGGFYMILTKVLKKGVPAAQIHFISDLSYFKKIVESLTIKLCMKLKVLIVMIDERYLKGVSILFSARVKLPQPRIFKSESLKGEDIDSLYSELVVLNI